MKVCHIISGHDTNDVRVFQKQCISLAEKGYDVILLCSDGLENREISGVKIVSIKRIPKGRFRRFLFSTKEFYKEAKKINADIYHIHEPFLLKVGKKLKKFGKKVIFDSHEDYPSMLLSKPYIPKLLRKTISKIYERRERACVSCYDAVIGVTPSIVNRLSKYNHKAVVITNVPILRTDIPQALFENNQIVFPGLVERIWRIDSVIQAIDTIENVTFAIRTRNYDSNYLEKLKAMSGWNKVDFAKNATHDEVLQLLSDSICGIAIADYCPDLGGKMGTLGNTKIFEYMMAGIPVICTDFILWREIIDKYKCGICVVPDDINGICDAIEYLLNNKETAKKMGDNGKRAVREEFNWQIEVEKLYNLYDSLTN